MDFTLICQSNNTYKCMYMTVIQYTYSYMVRVAKLDDVISMEKSETIKTTAQNNNLVLMFCQPSVTKIG